jgi:hypothetical protein
MLYHLASCLILISLVACGSPSAAPVVPEVTSTSNATSTIPPTSTSAPTPASTETPAATATVESTRTPRPTRTQQPTEAPQAGLGITRGDIQFAFQEAPDPFVFQPGSDSNGQPRLIGQSSDKQATVELTGPADDLTGVGLVLFIPRDDDQATENAIRRILRFCELVIPGWGGCGPWITENLEEAGHSQLTTIQGDRQVRLTSSGAGDQLTIIVLVDPAR